MPKHASDRTSNRIIFLIDESERVFDRLCHFFDRVAPRSFWLTLGAIGAYALIRRVLGAAPFGF
jgi:hypothetical protein